jgi:hypothetical protein
VIASEPNTEVHDYYDPQDIKSITALLHTSKSISNNLSGCFS